MELNNAMSGCGPKLPIRDVRSSVATGGKPDIAQGARFGSEWTLKRTWRNGLLDHFVYAGEDRRRVYQLRPSRPGSVRMQWIASIAGGGRTMALSCRPDAMEAETAFRRARQNSQ